MTLKILSSDLNRKNPRRSAALLVLGLCCLLRLVFSVIGVQNTLAGTSDYTAATLRSMLADIVTPSFSRLVPMSMCFGLLLACASFRYLHSRREVDFYHTLPQTRSRMYVSLVRSDVLTGILACAVSVLFQSLPVLFSGYAGKKFAFYALAGFVSMSVLFVLFYLTMLTAILMTGKLFVSFLGFGVFCFYVPYVLGHLYTSLATVFYDTFDTTHVVSDLWYYFSPLTIGMGVTGYNGGWSLSVCGKWLAAAVCWCVVLFVLNRLLYKTRRLESAGSAMAFSASKPVIRILLVIPCAVYAGLFLHSSIITASRWPVLAGMLAGCCFLHALIEVIYRADLKGMFSYGKQLLFCAFAGTAIVLFFWLDLTGYDRYLPEKDALDSVMITYDGLSAGIGNSESSFLISSERPGVSGDDLDSLLVTLEEIVSTSSETKAGADSSYTVVDELAYATADAENSQPYTVTWHLKNGKDKVRIYYATGEQSEALCKDLIASLDYKKSVNSLYTASPKDLHNLSLVTPSGYSRIKLSDAETEKLIQTYLEEYGALDYTTFRTEAPQSYLSTSYYNAISSDSYEETEAQYFLYPSFTKTIAFLEEHGLHVTADIRDFDITSISWTDYDEDNSDEDDYEMPDTNITIDDADEIASVKGKLFNSDIEGYNNWSVCDYDTDLTVAATDKETGADVEIYMVTDSETMQELKDFAAK